MICPLKINNTTTISNDCLLNSDCIKKECAWWCPGENCCAIKLIALQMIKLEEK